MYVSEMNALTEFYSQLYIHVAPWPLPGAASQDHHGGRRRQRGPRCADHRAIYLPRVCLFISSFLMVDQDVIR